MLLDFDMLKDKYSMKINGVLHIGGHFGQEYKIYEKHGIKNLIFFEPTPATFKVLSENIGNKAMLVNKALGNENTKVLMNIETANQGQSNSILKPALHLKQYPHIVFNDKIEVDMIKLDDFMSTLENDNSYNLINMDVQGYELEVLKGAKDTLNKVDYIISEVNRDVVYQQCAFVEDLDAYLAQYGFVRVETSFDGILWGDAFYIKY